MILKCIWGFSAEEIAVAGVHTVLLMTSGAISNQKPKIQHAARIPAMPMLYTPILGHCFLSHSHISLVLFWRIKKSSSIYHVLSYIWNKWNSIRVFAIQVAQHRIPEWKNKRLFCRKLKKAANLPDFSVLSTLWYFPHPAFFWNWWTVMKRNVFKGLLQKFEQGCTEMPKVRANVKPPRIEATWLWREILQKAMMSIQKQYIILYIYIWHVCQFFHILSIFLTPCPPFGWLI